MTGWSTAALEMLFRHDAAAAAAATRLNFWLSSREERRDSLDGGWLEAAALLKSTFPRKHPRRHHRTTPRFLP